MAEKNRRLIQGSDIIYPITKQENVIGLQRTITEKLPIVSASTPQSGFVNRQVWLDTSGNPDGFGTFNSSGPLLMSAAATTNNNNGNNQNSDEELGFGEYNPNKKLGFGAL